MDNKVWCNVELGIFEQTVYCPDGTTVKVPTDYLAATLAQACYNFKLQDVYLFGPIQYIQGLESEILEAEKNIYNYTNIRVHFEGEF